MFRPPFWAFLLSAAIALGGCQGAGDRTLDGATAAASPGQVNAPDFRARMSELAGDVRVKKVGGMNYEAAVKGMELSLGDLVTTGASGHATLTFRDGSNATLTPQSLITIEPPATSAADGIAVERGRVDLEIDSKRAAEFRVKTPDAEASLK